MKTAYPERSVSGVVGTYTGLLVLLFFTLADSWSGIASLIMVYQILGAPIVMAIVIRHNYARRHRTRVYRVVFSAAVAYLFIETGLLVSASVYWSY